MTTVNVHFDGKVFVPDGPVDLPVGAPLLVHVEQVVKDAARSTATVQVTPAPRSFQPLDIQIAPELSHAIALAPEFIIEES